MTTDQQEIEVDDHDVKREMEETVEQDHIDKITSGETVQTKNPNTYKKLSEENKKLKEQITGGGGGDNSTDSSMNYKLLGGAHSWNYCNRWRWYIL